METFILIGRSGCGKGTQAELLKKYLEDRDGKEVYHLETGEAFRKFIKGNSFSSELSRKISEDGGLQPSFLAIHIWAELLIKNLKGDEHLIVDGTPRYLNEAKVLTTAMNFYGRKPKVLYLDVPREFSEATMKKRGRADDIEEADVKKRLDWFDTDVIPAIEYMKNEKTYEFIEIKGDQSIEEVQKEILAKIF